MDARYVVDDREVTAEEFLDLVQRVWASPDPSDYDIPAVRHAMGKTLNITAWHGESLVGCVRILTDGYLFGTVPDILVDPTVQRRGIGRRLMELAYDASPTGLWLGAQPGREAFFTKLGFEKGAVGFVRRKSPPAVLPA